MRLPLFIFFLVASKLFAQEKPDPRTLMPKRFIDKVEITVGPSLLSSHGNGYQSQMKTPKFGYSVGLGFSHRINDRLELAVNTLYEYKAIANKQTYVNDSSFSATTEVNFKINYLTISALPVFTVNRNRRLFVFAGPYYSIVLNNSGYYSGIMNKSGYNKSYAFWTPSTLSHIPNDAGCSFGVGYSFSTGKVKTSTQLGMNYGFVKINDWNETTIKNAGFSLLIKVSLRN